MPRRGTKSVPRDATRSARDGKNWRSRAHSQPFPGGGNPPRCSSMKYPKRCQYKHNEVPRSQLGGIQRRVNAGRFDSRGGRELEGRQRPVSGGQCIDMAETGLVVRMVYKLASTDKPKALAHREPALLDVSARRGSCGLTKADKLVTTVHLMIDSTGLRWNARKPTARMAQVAQIRIVASELTASRARDATRVARFARHL